MDDVVTMMIAAMLSYWRDVLKVLNLSLFDRENMDQTWGLKYQTLGFDRPKIGISTINTRDVARKTLGI